MTIQQHASFDSNAAELNATSKLVKAWESKNAKNAAKAGGVSLMALSLAACGGSSTTVTTPVVETPVETPVVETPVVDAAQAFTLTTAVNAFTGGSGADTFSATDTTLTAVDTLTGGLGSDTLVYDDNNDAAEAGLVGATITGIENLSIAGSGGVGTFEVTASGATTAAAGEKEVVKVTIAGSTTGAATIDNDVIKITVAGNDYTTTVTDTTITALLDEIDAQLVTILGGSATVAHTNNVTTSGSEADGYFTITANEEGVEIPTISVTLTEGTASLALTATPETTNEAVVAIASSARSQIQNITLASSATAAAEDVYKVTYNGATVTAYTGNSASAAATAVAATVNALNGADIATAAGANVVVTGEAGEVLPLIGVTTSGDSNNAPSVTNTMTQDAAVAVKAASGAVSAVVFDASGFADAVTVSSQDAINIKTAKTADVTLTAAAGKVTQTGGAKSLNVTASDDIVGTVTGDATVTAKKGADVTLDSAANVTITAAGSALNTAGTATSGSAYDSDTVLGEVASYSNAAAHTAANPLDQVDGNTQITGNVVFDGATYYTTSAGQYSAAYNAGDVTAYMRGGTEASITTAGVVVVKDVAVDAFTNAAGASVTGTSTLTTAKLDGSNAAAGVTSDALTNLSVTNAGASSDVTVTNAATGGHALNLTVSNNASGSAITDATATSVVVDTVASSTTTAANASASAFDLVVDKATSITINNSHAVTLEGSSTFAVATSIDLNGSAKVDLGDVSGEAKLTSINASGATGAVVAQIHGTGTTGFAYTGSAGSDTVSLDSSTANATASGVAVETVINLGAGDDTLLKAGSGAVATTGNVVDGGAGNDMVSTDLVTSANGAMFTSFEVLGLNLSTGTFDTDLLTTATSLSLLDQGGTYSNVNTSQNLIIATDTSAGTNTFTFGSTEASATTDAYTVSMEFVHTGASSEAVDGGQVVIEDIEAVNLVSTGTGLVTNAINLTGGEARTLTITGDKDLDLDFGATDSDDSTTDFFGTDSSAATDLGGVSAINAADFTGDLNVDTTDVGIAFAGITITTGSGDDTIKLVTAGTIVSGAGADVITVSDNKSTLTLGAGKDEVIVTASVGSDVITTILDIEAGDKIDFADVDSFSATAVDVSAQTTLAGALGAADGTEDAATYFDYGGDTYLVLAGSSTSAVTDDTIVLLSGGYDLSTATLDATANELTIA